MWTDWDRQIDKGPSVFCVVTHVCQANMFWKSAFIILLNILVLTEPSLDLSYYEISIYLLFLYLMETLMIKVIKHVNYSETHLFLPLVKNIHVYVCMSCCVCVRVCFFLTIGFWNKCIMKFILKNTLFRNIFTVIEFVNKSSLSIFSASRIFCHECDFVFST